MRKMDSAKQCSSDHYGSLMELSKEADGMKQAISPSMGPVTSAMTSEC